MAVSNRDDLDDWLKKQPLYVCVGLSYRAAMRVVPLATVFEAEDPEGPMHALFSLRAALAAGVVANNPSESNRLTARLAVHSRTPLDWTAQNSARAIVSSARCAGTSDPNAAFHAIATAAFAVSMASGGPKRRDRAIREICFDGDLAAAALASAKISSGITFRFAQRIYAEGRQDLLSSGGPWLFWSRWYARAMAGNPLPWDLQERIALIPNEIWKAGPEAVAEEIARIEAAFELRQRIAEVEADQVNIADKRLGIGGNNPPEEIDDPQTAQQVVILWDSIAGLKEQVEAEEPDAKRVAALIERLGAALRAVIAWCGRKGDLIVDTSIKWGIPAAGGGYFFVNPEKAEAVHKAAQAWLPFLAP